MSAQNHHFGTFAAEHLSPSFPLRAPWGTADSLRAWQSEALDCYFAKEPRDFLAAATPGAGKTTFALRLATELFRRREIDRITVVAPTEHLKYQWAEAAHRVGIRLDPRFANAHKNHGSQFHGVVVTYAQVAAKSNIHKNVTESARTLVILDEIHHGGDALSWGDAIRDAFEHAHRRLSLTGTPFRSDTAPIPFVTYTPGNEGSLVSQTDFDYTYGRALSDGVVRPVMFMVYSGDMSWVTKTGDHMHAQLGQDNTKDITAQAWKAALNPQGQWVPQVIAAADKRLNEVRRSIPDAAAMIIASDKEDARAYASLVHDLTGEIPTVVLSDERGSSKKIQEFSQGSSKWLVAVKMVSEGVDVPRLAVGVYATSAATPLFFAQAIGRFVRARRRGETATVFLPSIPSLLSLAAEIELQRDHALEQRDPTRSEFSEIGMNHNDADSHDITEEVETHYKFTSSEALFDQVLYKQESFGALAEPGTPEEYDFIGIPGLLEPDQISQLLLHRQKRQSKRYASKPPSHGTPRTQPLYRTLKEQRALLNSLVSLWSKRTNTPHGMIHSELRQTCGGPAVAQATVAQIQARIDLIRKRINSH